MKREREEAKSPLDNINSMLIIKEKIKASKGNDHRKSSKMSSYQANQIGRQANINNAAIKRAKLKSQVPKRMNRNSKRVILPELSNFSNEI